MDTFKPSILFTSSKLISSLQRLAKGIRYSNLLERRTAQNYDSRMIYVTAMVRLHCSSSYGQATNSFSLWLEENACVIKPKKIELSMSSQIK